MQRAAQRGARRVRCEAIVIAHAQPPAALARTAPTDVARLLAHELKTPMASLLLRLRLLDERAAPFSSPADARAELARLERACLRLVTVADTLGAWADAASGQAHLTVVSLDLSALVRGVVEELADDVRFAPALPALPALTSDARLARLAVHAVVRHAQRVTSTGSVTLSLRAVPGAQLVSVAGGGTGAAAFAVGDDDDGVGLCVARELARALRGDVTLARADGSPAGAHFVLTLPFIELPASA